MLRYLSFLKTNDDRKSVQLNKYIPRTTLEIDVKRRLLKSNRNQQVIRYLFEYHVDLIHLLSKQSRNNYILGFEIPSIIVGHIWCNERRDLFKNIIVCSYNLKFIYLSPYMTQILRSM